MNFGARLRSMARKNSRCSLITSLLRCLRANGWPETLGMTTCRNSCLVWKAWRPVLNTTRAETSTSMHSYGYRRAFGFTRVSFLISLAFTATSKKVSTHMGLICMWLKRVWTTLIVCLKVGLCLSLVLRTKSNRSRKKRTFRNTKGLRK